MLCRKVGFFWLLLLVVLPLAASPPNETSGVEVFNAGTIVQLQRAGIADETIAMAIRTAKVVKFDTSPSGLVAYKRDFGFSDVLLNAIVERSNRPSSGAVPARNQHQPVIHQAGHEVMLSPSLVTITFLASKKKDPMSALSGAVLSQGALIGAQAAAAGMAGSSAGMGIPLAGIGIAAWSGLRTKSIKGFEYELLQGVSATNVLTNGNDLEMASPSLAFGDGRYLAATPILLKLTPQRENQIRIIGTAPAVMKYKQLEGPKGTERKTPFKREEMTAAFTKTGDILTAKLPALAVGEYAVGFVFDGNLLPQVLDFSIR